MAMHGPHPSASPTLARLCAPTQAPALPLPSSHPTGPHLRSCPPTPAPSTTAQMKKTKPEPRCCPECGERVGLSADSVRVHIRLKHPASALAR